MPPNLQGFCNHPFFTVYSLVNKIKKIYSIEEFSMDIDDKNINGHFGDLREYFPRLAKFYLSRQGKCKDVLKWFGETEGSFLIASEGGWVPFC